MAITKCFKTCTDCKFWDNSDAATKWNKQHAQELAKPYKEYGECKNQELTKHVFFDINYFGTYTHKEFGCVFFEQ